METLIISPKTQKELEAIKELLTRLSIPSRILSDEEKEDLGMLWLMQETDRYEKVSREDIAKRYL